MVEEVYIKNKACGNDSFPPFKSNSQPYPHHVILTYHPSVGFSRGFINLIHFKMLLMIDLIMSKLKLTIPTISGN